MKPAPKPVITFAADRPMRVGRQLETCGFCNGKWLGGDVHAPHWDIERGTLLDCLNIPIQMTEGH